MVNRWVREEDKRRGYWLMSKRREEKRREEKRREEKRDKYTLANPRPPSPPSITYPPIHPS